MLGRGEVDGVRLVKPETIDLMTHQPAHRRAARPSRSSGMPFWLSQGFGLGVSTIMDAEKHQWMGAGGDGRLRLAGRLRHLVAGRPGRTT